MSGWLFLLVSLVGAAFTLAAVVRARRLWYFTFPYFMAGWLASELAVHHLAWQALATLVFAMLGAFESWPGILGLGITFASWAGLLTAHGRALGTAAVVRDSLAAHTPENDVALPRLANPFRMRRPGVKRTADIPYGDPQPRDKGRRNLLDVLEPRESGEGRPVLLQIHGGGWVIGEKEQQALPLMNHLVERGWVCVAANYRLSPRATFPDHIIDVKRAIAWIRDHIAEHGGDPNFICVTGGSAGGHLAALTALSANDPAYQPGFEEVDTRVAACVPFYGVYDFLDRHGIRGSQSMAPFLEAQVFKCSPTAEPELWENASPIARVHGEAPPFMILHGTHDSLAWVEEAREFVRALREKSQEVVVYTEFPGAQHAFDTFHSLRSAHAVHAVTAFLNDIHADYDKEASGG